MTKPVVTMATLIQCPHTIPGKVMTATVKVLVEGAPPLVSGDKGTVASCPFTVPTGKPQPCVTALFTGLSSKVLVEGKPVLLFNPTDICQSADQIPQGPVIWSTIQAKVLAS
jgi:hypothetical protein